MRWHWTDCLILLATLMAALVLLLVIRHHAAPAPIHPVACVQHPASDGRGMPACDGSQPSTEVAA